MGTGRKTNAVSLPYTCIVVNYLFSRVMYFYYLLQDSVSYIKMQYNQPEYSPVHIVG